MATDPSGQMATPRRNVELKARLRSLDSARDVAQRVATETLGAAIHQIDTYFHCRHGRLKLREIDSEQCELIWYDRANRPDAKTSNYRIVQVADASQLKRALAAALGTRTVVRKRREVFLYENVRIHLDEVEGLGTFIEFEAVLDETNDEQRGHEQLAYLSGQFAILPADLLTDSYGEMIEMP